MATVPGVLLVGDDQIMGGPGAGAGSLALEADTDGTGRSALFEFRDQDAMRIIPSSTTTGVATSGTLSWWPWWDPWSDYVSDAWATISSTSTTVTIQTIGAAFTLDELVGRELRLLNTSNIGLADRRTITANTATAANVTTVTVDSSWTVNPIAPQLVVCGRGTWTEYHPAAGYLHPNELGSVFSYRGGSAEFASVAGVGVGPDAGLLRLLWDEVYTTAPYFQFAKFRKSLVTATNWATGGDAITALAAEKARMDTAWTALATGDTLSWEWIIFDNSQRDVVAGSVNSAAYKTALEAAISALRTTMGNASAKVVLVNHDPEINNVTNAGGTLTVNRVHRTVAAADANVFVVNLTGLRTQVYESQFWVDAENRAYYARAEYWTGYPRKVVDRMKLSIAGTPPTQNGGFPVYYLIGDSIAAGPVTETFAASNDSPTLTATARGANQLIYVEGAGQAEQYDLGDNSLPSGTTTGGTGGPEFALMPLLEDRHPEGFMLIKRASVGSCLIADYLTYSSGGAAGGRWSESIAGEHWDALETLSDAALQWVNEVKGKQADVRGAFVVLGTNDQAKAGGGDLFEAELATFLSDFRTRFATRTVANGTTTKALPIVWLIPQLGTSTGIDDESRTIRAAIEARALADSQFQAVNIDDLERNDTDNLHPTQEAQITIAERFATELAEVALT